MDFMSYEFITYSIWIIVCIVLAIIIFLVLKRNPRSKINQIYSFAVTCGIIGVIIDLIKNPMTSESLRPLATFLNQLSLFFACFGMAFLLVILFFLYKPNLFSQFKYQFMVIFIYGALLSGIFFIPGGIELQDQPNTVYLVSVYSLPLMIYTLTILLLSVVLTLVLYVKISTNFKHPEISKRFKAFIVGDCILYYSPIGVCIVNFLNIPAIREIFSYTILVMFVGLFLVYYGIGKGFKSDD